MKHILNLYSLGLATFLTFAVFTSYTFGSEETKPTSNNATSLPQMVKAPKLKDNYFFAGEALPMNNFDIKERLDRELSSNSYYHSNTILNFKKANKYFPTIEKILAENGIPDDIKYIAVAESNLSNATSPVGAKGFWQFMKATAIEYGLEVNAEVDERYHLEKSTQAACDYLKNKLEKYNNWSLVAASYNMGEGKLDKRLREQRADSYFDLNLNPETARYLFRIVAIKEIMEHPEQFGFYLEDEALWQPLGDYAVVETNEAIENLGDFAKKYGISYRMLKIYNPWLKSHKLTNRTRKIYQIKIPKKRF